MVTKEKKETAVSEEEFDERAVLSALRRFRIIDVFMVRIFFVVFFAGLVLSFIPTLRSDFSQAENRELEKFPKFSFETLCNGEYFDDINLWFSDTFPFRDTLITVNGHLSNLYGIGGVQIHGEMETADEIPETSTESSDTESETASEEGAKSEEESVEEPQNTPIVEEVAALLLVDDTAYEYYNFNKSVADTYSASISRAADSLVDKANVYNIVVPTAIGIKLQPEIAANVNSSNQKQAIDYMYSNMSSNVKKVDVYDRLLEHKSDYLYFRTDHHWTALGAYHTYCEFMNARGMTPTPLSAFTEIQFAGFLGSFYNTTGKNPRLASNPDTVFAYKSSNVTDMTVTNVDKYGQVYTATYPIIRDGNAMGPSSKYLSFLGGDLPFAVITNNSVEEDSVCTIVKESFGNCFVPFIAENYRTVYVIDYRYFSRVDGRKLQSFVTESGTQDLIFINNISATRNASLVNTLNSLIE